MTTHRVLGLSVLTLTTVLGCASPEDPSPDEATDTASQAVTTYGACNTVVAELNGGSGGAVGFPGSLYVVWEAYGAFGDGGNEVSSGIICSFNDGTAPLWVSGSPIYQSSSQVNFEGFATAITSGRSFVQVSCGDCAITDSSTYSPPPEPSPSAPQSPSYSCTNSGGSCTASYECCSGTCTVNAGNTCL